MDGALFCSECGSQLVGHDSTQTHAISKDPTFPLKNPPPQPAQKLTSSSAWATLFFIDSGQVIPFSERSEYTLGRASEGQPVMPDIDLSAQKAYEHGVSRIHAVIKKQATRIVVMDLGSSNGTYLNGVRLLANIENPLANGDMIALGKLKMQILLDQT
jgi:pSer/pThr/pTyr-binding forkhead associated (FHA) protein